MSWPLVDPQRIKDGMAAAKERGVKIGRPRADVCKRGHVRIKTGACTECESLRLAARYAEKRDEILACAKERQTEQRRAAGVPIRRDGRDQGAANASVRLYQARKNQRLPIWADKEKIQIVYKLAKQMQRELGMRMAVDHIIPLKGEVVSGLHVHENLRIIPFAENARKSNSY